MSGFPVYSAVTDSNNSFEIKLDAAPSGETTNSHGLSDGAVTAIALGSTFGGLGILSGIGYYFLKHSKGLVCGCACGTKNPYQLIDIENPDFITKSAHTYLIKAYEFATKGKNYKYLVVPDTQIKPNTYNTVFFELPEELVGANFKIIQASAPYSKYDNIPELDTDMFSGGKNTEKFPASAVDVNSTGGVLIKQGKLSAKENNLLAVTTSYKTALKTAKTYAIIVVFEKI